MELTLLRIQQSARAYNYAWLKVYRNPGTNINQECLHLKRDWAKKKLKEEKKEDVRPTVMSG